MAASSKNTTEVDAEESHEWVWADKVGLVGGWVSRMARSKLSLSFVSDVQLSSGSVGIKVQEQQTGNPVYLLKGRLEKPDMKADIFGFGSGGNVYAPVTDAKGDLVCVYIKEISGAKATVSVLCPTPAFQGQLPSKKLSEAKEPIPETEAVPEDGWFLNARCETTGSAVSRQFVHESSTRTAILSAVVKASGEDNNVTDGSLYAMQERYTCDLVLPSILSLFASSLTIRSPDGSVAAKIDQSPFFAGSGCTVEVGEDVDVLAVLFLYCSLCT